jgi:hypothetical protein
MPRRNEPISGESGSAAPAIQPFFGQGATAPAGIAGIIDLESSAMHRLSELYAALAREPVPPALATLVKRLRI